MNNKVVILHEYGAPNHFRGLIYLLNNNNINYAFYELNWWAKIKKGLKQGSLSLICRGIRNLMFLQFIPLIKTRKVILSIAPYNPQMVQLRRKLKKHQSYFFISYTIWDQSTFVHDYHNDERILEEWRNFLLKDVSHIFVVSEKTKAEMIKNHFATANKISVVNHSYHIKPTPKPNLKKTNSFIAVGGLVHHKGTEELLEIFSKRPELQLTLVGKGDLLDLVQDYCKNYNNIIYKGYITNQEELFSIYQQSSFFILNSHRTKIWEELFGMVLIESSACGLIPIATDHSGPKEIIHNGIDGFICQEGDIISGIEKCISLSETEFSTMRHSAIVNGLQYHEANISLKWIDILS